MSIDPPQPLSGFRCHADPLSRILILGSFPGVASLQVSEYYAHPRNLFWPMMIRLLSPNEKSQVNWDYGSKIQLLHQNHIALWDTAKSCQRPGSLDSKITEPEANDFDQLYNTSPNIRHVFFNGLKSGQLYQKLVLKKSPDENRTFTTLPSTSPANASMSADQKYEKWRVIRELALDSARK